VNWKRELGAVLPDFTVNQPLLDYYRIPQDFAGGFGLTVGPASGQTGFFQFGDSNICYGQCQIGASPDAADSSVFDASKAVRRIGSCIELPFDFNQVIENLRLERYRQKSSGGFEQFASSEPIRRFYYLLRNALPFRLRRQLQRIYFKDWKVLPFPAWPVDLTVDRLHEELLRLLMETTGERKLPFIWFWPEGAPSCLLLTHDVETSAGRDFTFKLMDLDDAHGFKAAYQVIPEKRYQVPDEYVAGIRTRGCEFNIHDLNHDGRLYAEREEFARRAAEINGYLRKYDSHGFRAGAMYRRQDWYDVFEFAYDMSVPNVAHLEPLRGGCCTVLPYFIGKILEIPLTTAQDYSVFQILNDYSLDLWKEQIRLVREHNGLLSFLTHPDYLIDDRSRHVYESLLSYLREIANLDKIWVALPAEIDRWWRQRSQMKLIKIGGEWAIEGAGKERARVAHALLEDGQLTYEVAGNFFRRPASVLSSQ
jgi:hypothetical protein